MLVIFKCRPLDWKVPIVISHLESRLDSRSLPTTLVTWVTATVGAPRSVSALWRIFPALGVKARWSIEPLILCETAPLFLYTAH